MARFTVESARKFLYAAEVFYYNDPTEEMAGIEREYGDRWTPELAAEWRSEIDHMPQTLNMNDVWGWACADCYRVPDDQLVECADLFWRYGWCGILYFVSVHTENQRSEFLDNNRAIDFVRHEVENAKGKTSSQAAYAKLTYTLGLPEGKTDGR